MKYELIYIINTAVEEEARKALIARFNELIESNGGSVEKVNEWGKRRLAYAINDLTEGYYVLVSFSSDPSLPREIERNLENSEDILRYLVTCVEEKRSKVKPRAQQPVRSFAAPQQAEEAAAEASEENAEAEALKETENDAE